MRRSALLLLASGLAAAAAAAGPPGPRGGEVREAGPYRLELVAQPGRLTLYVTSAAGEPVDTTVARATAAVIDGKRRTELRLAPVGDNILKGAAQFELTPATRVHILLAFPEEEGHEAEFRPGQAARP